MLLHDALPTLAAERPDAPALIGEADEGGPVRTWSRVYEAVERLSACLRQRGLNPGERVVVIGPNTPATAEALLAVWTSGGVAVPLPGVALGARVASALSDCGAGFMLAAVECQQSVGVARAGMNSAIRTGWFGEGALTRGDPDDIHTGSLTVRSESGFDPGTKPEDLAAIIRTSGSTGEPKGVMMTHGALASTAATVGASLGNTRDDVVASVLPLSFSYGLLQLLTSVRIGHALVLSRGFTFPAELAGTIARHRVTGLPAVPTIIARLIGLAESKDSGLDLSSLRYITSAAAPLPPAHALRLADLLPHAAIIPMYGQTECARASMLDPALTRAHPESCGTPIAGCEALILDHAGRPVAPGETGELVLRGPNLMRGYWNHPTETAVALAPVSAGATPDLHPLPALHTRDLFRRTTDGLLYFVSRTDDVFKCRGEKVAPKHIEHALCELPGVLEALVVGVPDPADGTAIKAVIIPREGIDLSEAMVRRHCKARLEPAFLPRFIEFAAELPKTESGKVRRAGFRAPGSA